MHIDYALHSGAIGEAYKMEKTAAQKCIRQFFFIVTGNNHNRPLNGFNRLAGFIDMKLHAIQFQQQVIGEFNIRFINFIN